MDEKIVWGDLPPVDGTSQITRSMLELTDALPYQVDDEDELFVRVDSCNKSKILQPCHFMDNSIKHIEYMDKVNGILSSSEGNIDTATVLPHFPEAIKSEKLKKSSCLNHDKKPVLTTITPSTVDKLTSGSVAKLALAYGYHDATRPCLDLLSDLTRTYMENMCKALRCVVDNEALTGTTAYYDAVDQVLHDHDIHGLKGIHDFYTNKVKNYNSFLRKKASKLKKQAESKIKQQKDSKSRNHPYNNSNYNGDMSQRIQQNTANFVPIQAAGDMFFKTEQATTSNNNWFKEETMLNNSGGGWVQVPTATTGQSVAAVLSSVPPSGEAPSTAELQSSGGSGVWNSVKPEKQEGNYDGRMQQDNTGGEKHAYINSFRPC